MVPHIVLKQLIYPFLSAFASLILVIAPISITFQAQAQETLTIKYPQMVTTTSAVLSGHLVTDSDLTKLYFQYGTSPSALVESTFKNYHTTHDGPIYEKISNLRDGTTYYYRLCLASGDLCSTTQAFTTQSLADFTKNLSIEAGDPISASYGSAAVSAIYSGAIPGQTLGWIEYHKKGTTLVYATPKKIIETQHGRYSTNLHHLSPLTEYYFQLCLDELCGSKGTFTTTGTPSSGGSDTPSEILYSVTTGGVDSITSTSAKVRGSLQGTPSLDYYFLYEKASDNSSSGNLTLKTSEQEIGQSTLVNVSGNLSQLIPNTSYRYQLCTSKGCGDIKTFTTETQTQTQNPSVVTIATPSANITHNQAVISGTYTQASGTPVFHFGTTQNLGQSVTLANVSGSGSIQTTLSPLAPTTTYYYKVCVSTTCGSTLSFTTTQETTNPPSETNPLVSQTGNNSTTTSSSATFRGSYSQVNPSTDIVFFRYGTSSSAVNSLTQKTFAPVVSGTHSATVTALSPNTTYYYRLCVERNSQEYCGPISPAITQSTSTNTAPTIVLNGNGTMFISRYSTFTDPGALANDEQDGNNLPVTLVSGSVNTSQVGTYTITYRFTDSGGLSAIERSRTVVVQESTTTTTPTSSQSIAIETLTAQSIEENTAKIRGAITSMGNATKIDVTFYYGTKESNLSKQEPLSGSLSDRQTFSLVLESLQPATRYYYKACGEDRNNSANDDCGDVESFTTDSSATTTATTATASTTTSTSTDQTTPRIIYTGTSGPLSPSPSPTTQKPSSAIEIPTGDPQQESTAPTPTTQTEDPFKDRKSPLESQSEESHSQESSSASSDTATTETASGGQPSLEPSLLGASAQDAIPVTSSQEESCTTCTIAWSSLIFLSSIGILRKTLSYKKTNTEYSTAQESMGIQDEVFESFEDPSFENITNEYESRLEKHSRWRKTFMILASIFLVGLTADILTQGCMCYVGIPVGLVISGAITYKRHGLFFRKNKQDADSNDSPQDVLDPESPTDIQEHAFTNA